MSKQEIEITKVTERVATSGTVDIHDIFDDDSAIATYQLDGDATDLGGNYDGDATDVTYSAGKFGDAGVFNGDSSKTVLIPKEDLTYNEVSVSLWTKYTHSNNANNALFTCLYSTHNSGFGINVDDSGELHFYIGDGDDNLLNTAVAGMPNDTWCNIVASINANTGDATITIDGAKTDFTFASGKDISAQYDLVLGTNGEQDDNFLDGQMDQVRIFNKALTEDEVEALYNEESTRYYQDLEFTEDIVATSVAFENTATTLVEASDTYDGTKFTKSYSKVTKGGRELAWSASADKDLEIQKVSVALNKEPS